MNRSLGQPDIQGYLYNQVQTILTAIKGFKDVDDDSLVDVVLELTATSNKISALQTQVTGVNSQIQTLGTADNNIKEQLETLTQQVGTDTSSLSQKVTTLTDKQTEDRQSIQAHTASINQINNVQLPQIQTTITNGDTYLHNSLVALGGIQTTDHNTIVTHTGQIQTNTANIETNRVAVQSLTSQFNTDHNLLVTHTGQLSTHTTNIETNRVAIQNLSTQSNTVPSIMQGSVMFSQLNNCRIGYYTSKPQGYTVWSDWGKTPIPYQSPIHVFEYFPFGAAAEPTPRSTVSGAVWANENTYNFMVNIPASFRQAVTHTSLQQYLTTYGVAGGSFGISNWKYYVKGTLTFALLNENAGQANGYYVNLFLYCATSVLGKGAKGNGLGPPEQTFVVNATQGKSAGVSMTLPFCSNPLPLANTLYMSPQIQFSHLFSGQSGQDDFVISTDCFIDFEVVIFLDQSVRL